MMPRICRGTVPRKPHSALRVGERLLYEHCLTRQGFDGPHTISYHLHPPQAFRALSRHNERFPVPVEREPSRQRWHLPKPSEPLHGSWLDASVLLLYNADVRILRTTPTSPDDQYYCHVNADQLLYVHEGGGILHSALGSLQFRAKDYVYVPRGLTHRFELQRPRAQHWLVIQTRGAIGFPTQYVNGCGQLRMDAPYSHRDFSPPLFNGPRDEGLRSVAVLEANFGQAQSVEREAPQIVASTVLRYPHSPLDTVGYDGCVYPWKFNILDFQPRVGSIHLPPTTHGTFAAPGVLVCSFVPRPLDFHQDAIPCPYPHASVDVDEVLFYSEGEFTSRRGVGSGSLSFHPRGLTHGPQPGRYEQSIGVSRTEELAVMLDCSKPLFLTPLGLDRADAHYEASFSGYFE